MYPDAEALLDCIETLRRGQLGACSLDLGDEADHLDRDLVPVFGTPAARQQTGESSRLQGMLGLVEGRSRNAERRGSLADGDVVDLVPPHHLVANLNQVPRIEK